MKLTQVNIACYVTLHTVQGLTSVVLRSVIRMTSVPFIQCD